MQVIEIKLGKKKIITFLLAAVVFVVVSSLFILHPEKFVSFIFFSKRLIRNIGFAGVSFFGLALIILIIKFFDNKPGLIIDRNGITDNTNFSSIGLIKWSDITGIGKEKVLSTEFLLIKVKNPENYIEKSNPMKKISLKQNMNVYGTPITITANGLECSFEELEQLINENYNKISNG